MMHVKLNELRGRKVFDANGREIGRVKAALVDMETWLVDTLQIRVARQAAVDLDMPWSFLLSFFRPPTVNVATGQINAAGDAIILRVSLAELREAAPSYTIGELAAVH
jgi:sporulation protein YlmC with PRC-barrel domain